MLSSSLTNEQIVKFKKHHINEIISTENAANVNVSKYFPRSTQALRLELIKFFKKSVKKGDISFKNAFTKECDNKTAVLLMEKEIAFDVKLAVQRLFLNYPERKKKKLTELCRSGYVFGVGQAFGYWDLLDMEDIKFLDEE